MVIASPDTTAQAVIVVRRQVQQRGFGAVPLIEPIPFRRTIAVSKAADQVLEAQIARRG
jgi:hypothetical protein